MCEPKAPITAADIPKFEDRVAQRAILILLEPIYETYFLRCSYGFRRGRSAHDALIRVHCAYYGLTVNGKRLR